MPPLVLQSMEDMLPAGYPSGVPPTLPPRSASHVSSNPSSHTSAASRLADRFNLRAALSDFRRAVDRLKRRLDVHGSHGAAARTLYGSGGEEDAAMRFRHLAASAAAEYRSDVALLLSRVRNLLLPLSLGRPGGAGAGGTREEAGGMRSQRESQLGAEEAGRAASETLAELEARRALMYDILNALEVGRQVNKLPLVSVSRHFSCGLLRGMSYV